MGFVFGSPTHYASATGFKTLFMDRLFYFQHSNHLLIFNEKPAAVIVTCGRSGSSSTQDQLNKYFTISNMPVFSSQY